MKIDTSHTRTYIQKQMDYIESRIEQHHSAVTKLNTEIETHCEQIDLLSSQIEEYKQLLAYIDKIEQYNNQSNPDTITPQEESHDNCNENCKHCDCCGNGEHDDREDSSKPDNTTDEPQNPWPAIFEALFKGAYLFNESDKCASMNSNGPAFTPRPFKFTPQSSWAKNRL